ncbi:MAG: hypothetical protein AT713_00665 [Caldivirga sp. JCHS_4]|nr:MAG: hypothetical protein AT713_00665 [Caldivirga sp. JCHS_4]
METISLYRLLLGGLPGFPRSVGLGTLGDGWGAAAVRRPRVTDGGSVIARIFIKFKQDLGINRNKCYK